MFQINWVTKSFLYKIFEFFRLKKTFYFIQKYITKRSQVNIDRISNIWKYHAKSIKNLNAKTLIEIGGGKSLEQNVYFSYLFDNNIEQTVIDINKMLDYDLFNKANFQISKVLNIKTKNSVKNVEDLKRFYNINYKAPSNLDDFSKHNKFFDICVNTTTLEHFSVEDLKNFLQNIKKILVKKGSISSIIDYSDHYSHTDKNIESLNFLKFSEDEWSKFNNSYLFQNRLRHYDYENLFKKYNFSIIEIIKGEYGNKPEKVNDKFNTEDKDTFLTWGYFLIQKN